MRETSCSTVVEKRCVVCRKAFQTSGNARARLYCSEACRQKAVDWRKMARGQMPDPLNLQNNVSGCRGCFCWSRNSCDYIGVYGHCRSAAIQPNGGCALYSVKERADATEKNQRVWSTARAKKLLASGLTPEETAKKLKCSPNSVKAWLHHGEVSG